MLLREPETYPSGEVLKNLLGSAYEALEELEMHSGLTFEWRYYKDSKAWLCKVCHKKKTVFWLSVWDGFFKTTFFFLERHLEGIAALEIDTNSYELQKEWGKMIPFIFNIRNNQQLSDLLKMVAFKKAAK